MRLPSSSSLVAALTHTINARLCPYIILFKLMSIRLIAFVNTRVVRPLFVRRHKHWSRIFVSFLFSFLFGCPWNMARFCWCLSVCWCVCRVALSCAPKVASQKWKVKIYVIIFCATATAQPLSFCFHFRAGTGDILPFAHIQLVSLNLFTRTKLHVHCKSTSFLSLSVVSCEP